MARSMSLSSSVNEAVLVRGTGGTWAPGGADAELLLALMGCGDGAAPRVHVQPHHMWRGAARAGAKIWLLKIWPSARIFRWNLARTEVEPDAARPWCGVGPR